MIELLAFTALPLQVSMTFSRNCHCPTMLEGPPGASPPQNVSPFAWSWTPPVLYSLVHGTCGLPYPERYPYRRASVLSLSSYHVPAVAEAGNPPCGGPPRQV